MSETFKVRLEPTNPADGAIVVFHATPDITESRSVNYKTVEPAHMPGTYQAYNNTASRTFSIQNIKLISRTPEEASRNLARINMLRSWTMSKFGDKDKYQIYANSQGVAADNTVGSDGYGAKNEDLLSKEYQYYGQNNRTYSKNNSPATATENVVIGLPPAVLELSAYSNSQHRGNIYRVPVVITSLSIPYPSDVDYIPTSEGTPFPILMTLGIDVTEVHSPKEYERFNIINFRRGELLNF